MADLVTVGLAAGIGAAVGDDAPSSFGRSVLTDSEDFSFKGVRLAGSLLRWNDRIAVRLALHQYLKRDGAEVEAMGAEPGRFTMVLCFLGPLWRKQYEALVALIRKDPKGELVHPTLGSLRVACEGISDASVVPGQEIDTVTATVAFVEDAVDAITLSERFPGPAAQQGRVSDAASRMVDAVAAFATSAQLAATLAADAVTFAAAVRQAFASSGSAGSAAPDPSFDARLAAIRQQVDGFSSSLRSEAATKGKTDGSVYEALQQAEQVFASCLALMDAVSAARPALIEYVVQADTNVATLCATLYGADALSRVDEVLALNRVPAPHRIVAGTRLQVSEPTV